MESKIKNENFVVIQGWMLNELDLKGNDLMVYAIIYGFSQSENKCYDGGLQYLADWCNSSVNGIQKNLKNLIGKGLIDKKEIFIKNVKFCEYTTKFDTIQLSCMGGYNNVKKGIQLSCNNNINNNINNNKKENNKEKMKIKNYQEHKDAIKEDYLYKVASIYKLNKNTIYSLLDAFVNINKDKKSNEFKFCQHFENWLQTDKGQQAINNTRMTSNITNNYQQD